VDGSGIVTVRVRFEITEPPVTVLAIVIVSFKNNAKGPGGLPAMLELAVRLKAPEGALMLSAGIGGKWGQKWGQALDLGIWMRDSRIKPV